MLQIRDGGLQAAAVGAELLCIHGQEAPGPQGVPGGGQRVLQDHGEVLQRGVQFLGGEGQMGVLPRQHPGGQQRLHVLLLLEDRVLHPLVHPAALTEEHHRVRRQVVDPGGDSRIDGCQIPVRRPRGRAAAQPLRVLPQRLDDGLRLLLFRQLLRQGGQLVRKTGQASGGAVGQHLRRRQDPSGGHVPGPPLGAGVEGAHGVDLIVKKLAPHRLVHQGREHVQNAAPQGELAHALHLLAPGIPGGEQLLRQRAQLCLPPHLQGDGQGPQGLRRQGPGHEAVRGGHHHRRVPLGQGVQRRQTAPLPVPRTHGPGAELPLPAKQGHGAAARQGLQISGEDLDLPLVPAEEHRRTAAGCRHRRAHAGPLHRLEAADRRGTAALLHPADQLRRLGDSLQLSQKLFHRMWSLST